MSIRQDIELPLMDLVLRVAWLEWEVVNFRGEVVGETSKSRGTPLNLMSGERLKAMGWTGRIGLKDGIAGVYGTEITPPAGALIPDADVEEISLIGPRP